MVIGYMFLRPFSSKPAKLERSYAFHYTLIAAEVGVLVCENLVSTPSRGANHLFTPFL